jgi:hypothetical protein
VADSVRIVLLFTAASALPKASMAVRARARQCLSAHARATVEPLPETRLTGPVVRYFLPLRFLCWCLVAR